MEKEDVAVLQYRVVSCLRSALDWPAAVRADPDFLKAVGIHANAAWYGGAWVGEKQWRADAVSVANKAAVALSLVDGRPYEIGF